MEWQCTSITVDKMEAGSGSPRHHCQRSRQLPLIDVDAVESDIGHHVANLRQGPAKAAACVENVLTFRKVRD